MAIHKAHPVIHIVYCDKQDVRFIIVRIVLCVSLGVDQKTTTIRRRRSTKTCFINIFFKNLMLSLDTKIVDPIAES